MKETPQLPPALQSVRLSELGGIEVGWAMCRNRLCENFGVLYGSDAGGDVHPRYEVVYTEEKPPEIVRITCRYCTADIPLYPVQSLRPIVRHFLSESLPFADCPIEDCDNHGRNVFESLAPEAPGPRRASPYHLNGKRLKCNGRRRSTGKQCGQSITLGSLNPKGKDGSKKQRLIRKCLLLIRLGLSGTHANGIDIDTQAFNDKRIQFGACFRDYHAYRNSFLLKPEWCGQEEKTATVLTDVLQVSLKRFGNAGRSQRLNVIVSVLRLRYRIKDTDNKDTDNKDDEDDKDKETTTWFVLAAHPYYLPESKCPDVPDLEIDMEERPKWERRFAGLNHFLQDMPFVRTKRPRKRKKSDAEATEGSDAEATEGSDADTGAKPEKEQGRRVISETIPDAGHYGCMMRSPYAEVAHFLVVQRMLSRFKRLHFYTDASYDLTWSALVAMREGVRSGRVQIAVLQHEKVGRKDRVPVRHLGLPRDKALPQAFADMEQRFEESLKSPPEESAELPLWPQDRGRARAALWRHSPQGAQSDEGKFAWLVYPRDTRQYKNCRTLWLTRGPDEALEDAEELLLGITLQSVDSACRTLRKRINSFKRPDKAASGVSYTDAGYRVEHAMGELGVHLLQRNYSRRLGKRWSTTTIPAVIVGLTAGDDNAVDMQALLWDFRLGIGHAREIYEWMTL